MRYAQSKGSQHNISQHCWAQHVARFWPPYCDVLWHVATCWVLLAQIWKWSDFHATFEDVAWVVIIWPGRCNNVNACNMFRPTMLRYVAFKCCDRLAGACKCWANNVGLCWVEMSWSFGPGFKQVWVSRSVPLTWFISNFFIETERHECFKACARHRRELFQRPLFCRSAGCRR